MIPLRLKSGVRVRVLTPQIVLAIGIALPLWEEHGAPELVITSCNEGKHRRNSEHWMGYAVDLRTNTLYKANPDIASTHKRSVFLLGLLDTFRLRLGYPKSVDYQVMLEHVGKSQEHAHLEFDPQGSA